MTTPPEWSIAATFLSESVTLPADWSMPSRLSFQTAAIRLRTSMNPGMPIREVGGQYVPP